MFSPFAVNDTHICKYSAYTHNWMRSKCSMHDFDQCGTHTVPMPIDERWTVYFSCFFPLFLFGMVRASHAVITYLFGCTCALSLFLSPCVNLNIIHVQTHIVPFHSASWSHADAHASIRAEMKTESQLYNMSLDHWEWKRNGDVDTERQREIYNALFWILKSSHSHSDSNASTSHVCEYGII